MLWALLGLLVVTNIGWLVVIYGAGRRIVHLEALLRQAADALARAGQAEVMLRHVLAAWPRGRGN